MLLLLVVVEVVADPTPLLVEGRIVGAQQQQQDCRAKGFEGEVVAEQEERHLLRLLVKQTGQHSVLVFQIQPLFVAVIVLLFVLILVV